MKLEGSYTFIASQDIVWEMLLDPAVLANIMPGCQKLEQTGEGQFEGELKIKVGPVQGVFKGQVHLTELQQPDSYKMSVSGKGPAGIVNGTGHIRLESQNGQTTMLYEGDATVSGKIASVGQRLMDASAKAIVKESLENLNKQVEARVAAVSAPPTPAEDTSFPSGFEQTVQPMYAPPPAGATPPPPPSQTEFALGVAQEVLNDFVPSDQQKFLWLALGMLGAYIFFNWWTNRIARRVARLVRFELRRNMKEESRNMKK